MPTYPEVWTIITWWTAQLEPIVTGVKSVLTEFTPYFIYVVIWILIATLWFLGVKRLMKMASWRAVSIFSTRRRRR
jgi:hypothetical protein